MIKATTPMIIMKLPKIVDFDIAKVVYATFTQDDVSITKTLGKDMILLEDNVLAAIFTQEETAKFIKNSLIEVQVNWIDPNGGRLATKIKHVSSNLNLISEVLP